MWPHGQVVRRSAPSAVRIGGHRTMSAAAHSNRQLVLKVRVSSQELAVIKHRAAMAQQTASEFVRAAVLTEISINTEVSPANAMAELIAALASLNAPSVEPMLTATIKRLIVDLVPAVRAELGLDR